MIKFNQNQMVEIVNEDQFKRAYPCLRSFTKHGIPYEQWYFTYDIPDFPVYLEHFGETIGFTTDLDDNNLEIITFEQAYKP